MEPAWTPRQINALRMTCQTFSSKFVKMRCEKQIGVSHRSILKLYCWDLLHAKSLVENEWSDEKGVDRFPMPQGTLTTSSVIGIHDTQYNVFGLSYRLLSSIDISSGVTGVSRFAITNLNKKTRTKNNSTANERATDPERSCKIWRRNTFPSDCKNAYYIKWRIVLRLDQLVVLSEGYYCILFCFAARSINCRCNLRIIPGRVCTASTTLPGEWSTRYLFMINYFDAGIHIYIIYIYYARTKVRLTSGSW